MSCLLIDIGNSRIKWLLHPTEPHQDWRSQVMAHSHHSTDWAQALRAHWHNLSAPQRIICADVAHAHIRVGIEQMIRDVWGDVAIEYAATAAEHPLMRTPYAAGQMGVDRYLQLLGARAAHPASDVCLIGCGTALTIDALRADGTHLGGVISANSPLMRTAPSQYTARLPEAGGQVCAATPPLNTEDALATGVALSWVGAVTQFCAVYGLALEHTAMVATGGGAATAAAWWQLWHNTPLLVEPHMVLRGLTLIEQHHGHGQAIVDDVHEDGRP